MLQKPWLVGNNSYQCDTVTQPEPAQDDQVLIVKYIKKEPQKWFLNPLLALFKPTTK